jgi:protein involved in polysaccharide export with SLBB domain
MPLDKATDLIEAKIDSKFIGVEVFVSLTNIRDIQVIVAGNVFNPGPYTLSGNSNIFHALSVSGGPSEDGSFRSIDLIRNNKLIKTLDLYETFIYGKANFNERLRSGDLIFIRPYKNLVDINGAVKRPGQYELLDSDNLSSVITFANGLSNDADLQEVALLRVVNGTILKKKIYTLDELDIKPADKDSIFIRKYPFRYVSVNGAVKNPGSYILNQGDGILELINKAGGYLEHAYPFGGVLKNVSVREANQIAKQKLYEDMLNKLISISRTSESQQDITLLLSELKDTPVTGRLITEFNIEKLIADESLDIILQDGDEVLIPEKLDQVFVFGEVSSEGAVKFNEGFDVKKYIDMKGGYLNSADKSNVYVLHPNGETQRVTNKNLFMKNDIGVNLYAGSIIFIPKKINNPFARTQTAQAYASILGNIGVSLASVSVLKD